MSSARCLNWSRPPPGRHPALRKQVSCSEPSTDPPPQAGLSSPPARQHLVSSARLGRIAPGGSPEDLCHQFLVTGAIIHTNRFQNYHTYDQARRGGSASLVRSRIVPSAGDSGGRHRPASASALPADQRRGVLCKQLSLDQSILVQSSFTAGMATVASGGGGGGGGGMEPGLEAALLVGEGERTAWSGFNRKQQQRVGTGTKTDTDVGASKKTPKAGAGKQDSRINIKIFLGQTVQQDSSDTGVSDTEGTGPPGLMHASNDHDSPRKPLDGPTPTNLPTEASASYTAHTGAGKVKPSNGNGSVSGTNGTATSAACNSNNQPSATNSVPGGSGSSTPNAGNGASGGSGRNSSLAQRRAQFQANRQNSEAHDRRHPPLVRALSAPIRPADPETSKFLQGKKKPRRRKVLREKDEYNICEEDEFSDDGDGKTCPGGGGGSTFVGTAATAAAAAAAAATGKPFPTGLPLRSRSVLGGACDIETLVSLLSSGGSDSEKEQEPTQASTASPKAGTPTFQQQQHQFPSTHLPPKGRAPMLKKAGKSVSFQETDLKPSVATAGLNRDYRKPSFQPTAASRMRRTQQLVSTLNAFQLKDKDRDRGSEKDGNEENQGRPTGSIAKVENQTTSPSTSVASKPDASKATAGVGVGTGTNGDLQTPKEQECYRLFLKMSKKGLAVSYDTILRGMLTPTELRVLQKKKSREQRNNGDGTEGGGNGAAPETPSPENDAGFETSEAMSFEEIRGLKPLNFNRNPLSQDGQALLQLQDPPAPTLCDDKESETDDEETTSQI